MADAKAMITKARTQLLFNQPFFGSLALNLKLVEVDPKTSPIQTAGVDGKHMYYNPEWIVGFSIPELMTIVAHEVMHCVFNHTSRRQGREHGLFNAAGDYAINQILVDSGFMMPKVGLIDPQYKNMGAEEIYNRLQNDKKHQGMRGQNDPGGMGGSMDSQQSNQGTTEDRELDREWKQNLAQAAQAAKMAGKLPAGLERMVDDLIHTGTPWRTLLRKFLTEIERSTHSWSRPNRRTASQGVYLPSVRNEPLSAGSMVFVIDTSGSIGPEELKVFASEVNMVKKELRPKKLHVLWADAEVAGVQEFEPDDELTLEAKGGGGTDFRPAFKWVEDNCPDAKALIYLTDMYGAFPEADTVKIPTLWATMTQGVEAPFGETILIDTKPA